MGSVGFVGSVESGESVEFNTIILLKLIFSLESKLVGSVGFEGSVGSRESAGFNTIILYRIFTVLI